MIGYKCKEITYFSPEDCEVFSVNKQIKRYRIMRATTILSVALALPFCIFQIFLIYLDHCPDETFLQIQRALPWLFDAELTDFSLQLAVMDFFHYISAGIIAVITLCMLIFFISTFQEDLNLTKRRGACFYTLLGLGLAAQCALFLSPYILVSSYVPLLLLYGIPLCTLLMLISYLYFRFSSASAAPAPVHSVWTGYILFLCAGPFAVMYTGIGPVYVSQYEDIQASYFTALFLISLFLMVGDTRRYGIAIGKLNPPIIEEALSRAAGRILTALEILTLVVLAAAYVLIKRFTSPYQETAMDPIAGAMALCALILMIACTAVGMRVRLGIPAAQYVLHYLVCIAASMVVCLALSGIWAEEQTLGYAVFTSLSALLLTVCLLLLIWRIRHSRAPLLYLWGTAVTMGYLIVFWQEMDAQKVHTTFSGTFISLLFITLLLFGGFVLADIWMFLRSKYKTEITDEIKTDSPAT